MRKSLMSIWFLAAAGAALWPGWVAYERFDVLEIGIVAGVALAVLLLALVKREPLHSPVFWVGLVLGWVLAVNIEGGAVKDWLETWVVCAIAARLARFALESLSWMYHDDRAKADEVDRS